MNAFLTISQKAGIDIYAILLLLVVLFSIWRSDYTRVRSNKIFLGLLVSTLLLLITEIITRTINGRPGYSAHILNIASNTVLFVLNPVPAVCWIYYVQLQLRGETSRPSGLIKTLYVILAVHTVLAVSSAFFPLLFSVTPSNIYQRGPAYWITALLNFAGILATFAIILANRKKFHGKKFISLLFFPVLPGIGACLQVADYNITAIWSMTAVGILMIFINIQSRLVNTDYLTGLANRRQLDSFISKKMIEAPRSGGFSVLMLDLDGFKNINDRYGHKVGDRALEQAAMITNSSLRRRDFISRYAGDEFVVVLDTFNPEHIKLTTERLKSNFRKFNTESGEPYNLNFSIGFAVYDPKKPESLESIKNRVDKHMYQDKKCKQAAQAETADQSR